MLNLNRRDRIADPEDTANTVLKPAIYDPPGSANPGGGASAAHYAAARRDRGARTSPLPSARRRAKDTPESKLFVGVNIKLKGVEITDCDSLVIEGQVEATVHSKAMEIAKPGTLKGNAQIDVAEIHGEFVGELTARTRLVVHGTGRVSGTIRYGKLDRCRRRRDHGRREAPRVASDARLARRRRERRLGDGARSAVAVRGALVELTLSLARRLAPPGAARGPM